LIQNAFDRGSGIIYGVLNTISHAV